jgi:hypothetical protein
MIKLGCFLLASLFSCLVQSQEQSIVEVLEANGHACGRAVIVRDLGGGLALAITANHVAEVFSDSNPFRVRYRDGRVGKDCSVIQALPDRDIAILKVWKPEGVPAVEMSDEIGVETYTFDRGWFRQSFPLSIRQRSFDYYDFCPQPGESGGGVFSDGRLVGVVAGGWFWLERKDIDEPAKTWPLRAGRLSGIQELLSDQPPQ